MAHLALDSHDAVSQVQPRGDACALSLQRGDARIDACCMLTCACACTCDMCMHIYLGLMCRRALMLPSVARAQAVIKQAPRKSSLSESCGATIGSRAKPNTGTCSTHGSWVSAWAVHGQCMGRYW